MVKIILERNVCIGCGSCQAVCQKYWEMQDDGKVNLIGSQKLKTNL
ncbi:MAG: ferredoxin [Candidatus Nealsonbacteria bacterium]|nr:ferredoxin [Candidatus Nealsonbacteria bacterium]